MAVIIAGERSGVGKTTITLSLLATLTQAWGHKVKSFKVGPDYIDPMFHQALTGRACRNLDVILTSETYVQACFQHHTQACDAAVIEGVMGLFDGAASNPEHPNLWTSPWDRGSTAHIADLLKVPIILVVNASGTSRSIAALVHGYQTFAPQLTIAGVVLNRVSSPRHLELLTQALEQIQMPIMGVFYRQAEITIPDRHLGLVPTGELTEFQQIAARLTELGETSFQWSLLEPLLKQNYLNPEPNGGELAHNQSRINLATLGITAQVPAWSAPQIRLAVAQDAAFNFYYADNFEILESLGVELVAWSPLNDAAVPEQIQGLYFGGGFPEMFAAQLSQNQPVLEQLHHLITQGLPTYAECGGLMYLSQAIVDFEGHQYPMVGVLPTVAQMGNRLTLGYRQARCPENTQTNSEHQPTSGPDWILANEVIWGHEFHRSSLTQQPTRPLYALNTHDGRKSTSEGWQLHNLAASYVHLHFGGCPQFVARWLERCRQYGLRPKTYAHTPENSFASSWR